MTTKTPIHRHRPNAQARAKPRPFVEPRTSFAPQEHQHPKVRGQANVLTNSERAARAQARQRNNRWWPKYAEPYTCPELQQNPGIPATRFAAYSLPSRSGDWLYYPDGRVLPFPGSAADRAATPSPNRTNPRSAP